MKYLQEMLRSSQELGDKKQERRILNELSQIHTHQGDYAAALKHLEQSLRISQEFGDKKQAWMTLNCMTFLHGALGDYDAVLRCREQILSIADKKLGLNAANVALEDILWNRDVEQWKSYMRQLAHRWDIYYPAMVR